MGGFLNLQMIDQYSEDIQKEAKGSETLVLLIGNARTVQCEWCSQITKGSLMSNETEHSIVCDCKCSYLYSQDYRTSNAIVRT